MIAVQYFDRNVPRQGAQYKKTTLPGSAALQGGEIHMDCLKNLASHHECVNNIISLSWKFRNKRKQEVRERNALQMFLSTPIRGETSILTKGHKYVYFK
jgi:hypothetical protein